VQTLKITDLTANFNPNSANRYVHCLNYYENTAVYNVDKRSGFCIYLNYTAYGNCLPYVFLEWVVLSSIVALGCGIVSAVQWPVYIGTVIKG
jgi:hypothetical protein